MIKLVEDSLATIVTKVVNKNLFSLAFSENSCADGSNYVPNLAAAMCFFPGLASELKIPLFKGSVLPPHFQVRRGTCLGLLLRGYNLYYKGDAYFISFHPTVCHRRCNTNSIRPTHSKDNL